MEEEEVAESEIKIEPKEAQSAAAAAAPNATLADPSMSDAFLTPGSTHCETQDPPSGPATLSKAGPPSPGLVQPMFNTTSRFKKAVGAPVWPVVARLDNQKDAAAEQIKEEERHPAVKSVATVAAAVETGSTEKKKKKMAVKAPVESTPRRSGRDRKTVKRYKS